MTRKEMMIVFITIIAIAIMANIVNVRIDERLIHGQVAAFWTNTLNASRIMVIDDSAASDEIQKMALRMAAPSTVKLSVLSVEKACARLNDPTAYVGERLFVVFRGTASLEKAINGGAPITTVNVGNISNKVGSQTVYKSVNVSKEDLRIFRELNSRGIKFTAQMVPSDNCEDFMELIKNL